MKCRHCSAELKLPLVDLGSAPPSNAYLSAEQLSAPELWLPLRVLVCESCWLVQTEDFAQAQNLFDGEYSYFSSFSTSWLAHSEQYVVHMMERFGLDQNSFVVEVAANDGYLLQYFQQRQIPCLGIEPTTSTAIAARNKGIKIVEEFFGIALAHKLVNQGHQADLTVANNVLAHVPDINDFISGFAILLKPEGVATFEFPHLLRLIQEAQFDTIYHEHFSYLSLTAVQRIFAQHGLQVFDVEELGTHGGSLRVFAQRQDLGNQEIREGVKAVLDQELEAGLTQPGFYDGFQSRVNQIKNAFGKFLLTAQEQGKQVVGYGAAAKGNTLLNYAGVRPDLLAYVVDRNPAKQGKFLPGSRIPIVEEAYLSKTRPHYVVIFPWNLKTEIMAQLSYVREWDGQLVTAIPHLSVC